MASPNRDRFLKDIMSQIKFPFGKEDIRMELEEHILDKIDYYRDKGYIGDDAEALAIKDMGDPKEIGRLLNKEHNPFLGWMTIITSFLLGLLIFLNVIFTGWVILAMSFSLSPIRQIPKEDIVYRMDINEKVQIDDRVIKFTNIVYDKNGHLHIIYKSYDKKFWKMGWGFSGIGPVKDDKGNEHFTSSGYQSSGFVSKGRKTIKEFPRDSKSLTIEYDGYNRYYKVEIPLKSGESDE